MRSTPFYKKISLDYVRNILFGAEDSFVSTVGFLFGLATSGEYNPRQILFTGFLLISIEALSMGAGAYITEAEIKDIRGDDKKSINPFFAGLMMFSAYFICGILVLTPFYFIQSPAAKYISTAISLVSLFIIGYFPQKSLKAGIRTLVIAGLAILIGYLISVVFGNY